VYSVAVTDDFQNWLDGLRDRRAQVRISARLRAAAKGNLGDWKSVADAYRKCV
jgi:putative addiction module killer protein